MLLQRFLVGLLIGALGLPIMLCVLAGVGRLLIAMQDAAGAEVVGRVNLGLFILWVIDLVGLVIVQAIQNSGDPNPPQNRPE